MPVTRLHLPKTLPDHAAAGPARASAVAQEGPRSHSSRFMTDVGVALVTTTVLFALRAVCRELLVAPAREQPWLDYSMINSSLDVIGRIVICLTIVWALVVLIVAATTRTRISNTDWALAAVLILCCGLRLVPGEQWRVWAIQSHLIQPAPKNWLVSAAASGEIRLTNCLLANGADVDTRTRGGETPLGAAAAAGGTEIARVLIARGADVNKHTTFSGETPLTMAAQMNRAEMVRFLLDHGADPGARDVTGRTALDWARTNRNSEMTSLLQAAPNK